VTAAVLAVLATYYLWIKALHIISIIAWMAGLLYLPRLFVYHAEAPRGSAQAAIFVVMERRLLRGIMNPAMAASLLFGALLAVTPGVVDWSLGWFHIKVVAVLGLLLIHHRLARWRKDFAADTNTRSTRFYRIVNEVPTVLLILIVVMVVVKPL
jgi:protoporphyrinogen IX oxidase